MTRDFISYDDYMKLCINENIMGKSIQDTLVDFLNDLGVILHFKDFELLDTHVLNPKWVTGAVYKIINSEKLAENKGLLRLHLLDDILKKNKESDNFYPRDKYMYIIDLMKKFELCFEIDNKMVLVPDLLDIQEPRFYFNFNDSIKFLIEYDFLPKSVMPRFIVKMHKDIKNQLNWRTGVVLEDKVFNSTAVIKADESDQRIYIYVNGKQKRDYFSTIRKTFREINDSFEKLEVKELVPLPDNDEIAVEYEELIGYELERRDEYFIGKLRKGYSVKQLLDGIEIEEERKNYILDERTRINIFTNEVNMRDKYAAGQVGAQGPSAQAHSMTFNQLWNESGDQIDLSLLTKELAELRLKLKEKALEPEHDISIGAIASAESYAKEGNGPKTIEHLSKAGKWALDIATKIGVPVATEALKTALGL